MNTSLPPVRVTSKRSLPFIWSLLLAVPILLGLAGLRVHADVSPPGCTGSGLGISLFAHTGDVHIGDTLKYSVLVFNTPFPACDASDIKVGIVTPDGVTNMITLNRTTLLPGESDYYTDIVTYVVRSQDVRADGTLRATAFDNGDIHQNDTNSRGGGFQGVNTQVSLPCIQITGVCTGSVGEFGAIIFTGTVKNCGNTPLIGVTVSNLVNNSLVLVLGPISLATNQVVPFNGSWVPSAPCGPSTATLSAQGTDTTPLNPRTVTASVNTTCANVLTPGLKVTKVCPPAPVAPGQALVFSGTVSNTGNVTLQNIIVVNDQPAPNTPVFTLPSLGPGQVAPFTGSYLAPASCSSASTVTASATSLCGAPVSSSASSTCPILSTPLVSVTVACSENPVAPGGVLTYSGTVHNGGDIILNNVLVVSDRPAPNTTLFTVASLAPGTSANFTGQYTVPVTAVCSVTATVVASGKGLCSADLVTATAAATCPVTTHPSVVVTLSCPTAPPIAGSPITYTGTVSNTGDVALNNVVVVNNQPAPNTVVLTIPSLAPKASANFTATFTAPADVCSVSSTVSVTGSDSCSEATVSNTASATCPLVGTPLIAVTQACPEGPVGQDGILNFHGTVSNTGTVTLTNVVVLNDRSGTTPVFVANTLAPGVTANFTGSFRVPTNVCSVTSTVSVRATSLCGAPVSSSASSTCPILSTPLVSVTVACSENPVAPGGVLTYSGTVHNGGDIILNNVLVVSDRPAPNTTLFTVASLAPGTSANFTGQYTVPVTAVCSVTATVVASGKGLCSAGLVTATAAATCPVTTHPSVVVTLSCPSAAPIAGSPITYTGTVSNTGDVTLNNVVVVNSQPAPNTVVLTIPSLAPKASANFTATFTAPADVCSVSSTVSVTGSDSCSEATVSNTASATCPLVGTPLIAVTQACPESPVGQDGILTFRGTVSNTGTVTLTNVVVVSNQTAPIATTPGSSSGSLVAPTAGLVGYWPLDETTGNVALDASGSGNNGTVINATRVDGEVRGALSFNGGNSLVDIPNNAILNFDGAITLAAWIKPQATDDMRTIIGHGFTVSPNGQVVLQIVDGRYGVGSWNGSGIGAYLPVPAGDIGNWVHLAGVYTGTTWILYRNGVQVSNNVEPLGSIQVNANWAIGANGGGDSRFFNGLIDEVRVYNRALSESEIVAVANIPEGGLPGGPVFTAASLAPGEVANFTGSYKVPANSGCTVTSTLTASGIDRCTGARVVASATSTCPILTSPEILVTEDCPATPPGQGGILVYSGTVSNPGNVTLSNIVVVNNRPAAGTVVFTKAFLPPGGSATFTGSYSVPTNCCSVWSTIKATGIDCSGTEVSDTQTRTCPVLTAPQIAVTKVCSDDIVSPGEMLHYSGTVSNPGNIALTQVTVVSSLAPAGTPILGPIDLMPGESVPYWAAFAAPADFCGTDTVTVRGLDACTAIPVVNTVTTTCPVRTNPRIAVTHACPPQPTPRGGVHTFTGTVSNLGDVTLNNVYVVINQPSTDAPVLGPITLAPGGSAEFTGSYTAPTCCCEFGDTVTAHGQDRCTSTVVAATSSTVCPLLSTPSLSVTRVCPPGPVTAGGLYEFSGSVRNTGDVVLTNVFVLSNQPSDNTPVLGPIALAPGESEDFTGSYTVTAGSDPALDTVKASGTDICQGRTVSVQATCSGPVLAAPFAISPPVLVDGRVRISWTAIPGLTYCLQSRSGLQDAVWTTVPGNVTASGAIASMEDVIGPDDQRLYRVMILEK